MTQIKKKKQGGFNYWVLDLSKYIKNHYQLYLLILPAIIFVFIFAYTPIYGAQIAFRNYSISKGFWGSEWVGLKHFIRFVTGNNFSLLFKNTLGISIYSLVAGFPVPIILAFMFNELKSKTYKKTAQMVVYMPHFISTVAIGGLIILFLQRESGIFNVIRIALGAEGYDYLSDPKWFKTIYVVSGIWQSMGWGTVIYLAALSSVDPQIVEASLIDGASRLQKIWYIDFPTILPTIIILLLLNTGNFLNVGFAKILLLQNSLNMEASDVISTYVYRVGVEGAQFSYTTAIGLFNSVVNVTILVTMNKLVSKYSETSLW